MYDIQSYINTNCEYQLKNARLSLLYDKKLVIYNKYFSTTTQLKEIVSYTNKKTDNFTNYVHDISEINPVTGLSLIEEIVYLENDVERLAKTLIEMQQILNNMKGLQYKLFNEIVFNGTNVTKAVNIVAERNNIEPQTIWKHHYKKIKKDLDKLKKV